MEKLQDLEQYQDLIENDLKNMHILFQQRKDANKKLLKILTDIIETDNGGMYRFGQLIELFFFPDLKNMYSEEPIETLNNVKNTLKELNEKQNKEE